MKEALAAPDFAHFIGDWHLSPVLDTGDFVFLSGVTGAHPDLSLSPDPETQFRDAFSFVAINLEAAGPSLADVVEMTTYHVGLREHLATFVQVKDAFIKEPYPAWSAIGVMELITPGALLEIRVIARRG